MVKRINPERESSVMTNSILQVESAIDWLTITGSSNASWEKVSGMALSLWEDQAGRGNKHFHQSRHGFSMNCCGGVQYGQSRSGWMVVLQSALAAKFWMPFAAYAGNVTRVDLQVTIWYQEDPAGTISDLYLEREENPKRKGETNTTLILGQDRGDTLYVGSRSSAQFGRIYDKMRQSKNSSHYKNALRFEVEFKKPLSGEVMRWLLTNDPSSEQICAKVLNWFALRGIEVPNICTSGDNAIQLPSKETPIESKLNWLRKTVRPVYRQLKLLDLQTLADEAIGVTDDIQTVSQPRKELDNGSR